jgi:hypothetical protein
MDSSNGGAGAPPHVQGVGAELNKMHGGGAAVAHLVGVGGGHGGAQVTHVANGVRVRVQLPQ